MNDCAQYVYSGVQAPLECEPGSIWIPIAAILAIIVFYSLLWLGIRVLGSVKIPPAEFLRREHHPMHTRSSRLHFVSISMVVLPLVLPFIPMVSALGGTPPTLDCTLDFIPAVGRTGLGVQWFNTDESGNAYFAVREHFTVGGSDHDTIYKIDTNCGSKWTINDGCAATKACVFGGLAFPFGKDQTSLLAVSHGTETTSPGTDDNLTIQLRNISDGTLFSEASTPFTTERVADPLDNSVGEMPAVYFIRESDTDGDYLLRGQRATINTLARWSSDFTGRDWQATATGEGLNGDPFRPYSSTQFLNVKFGAPTTQILRNLTTGASMAASAGFTACSGGGGFAHHSTVNTSRIYVESCPGGSGAGANVGYGILNATTLTTVTAEAAFTPDQIDDGTARKTIVIGAQWDGADRLLACGQYDIGAATNLAWFGQFLSSNDTMHWNVTVDRNGGGTGRLTDIRFCRLDNISGLYVAGRYVDSSGRTVGFVQHYSGGGFTNPTLPEGTTNLVPTTQAPTAGDIAVGFNVFFTNICGTSEGSLFFCGLVLVITGMVVTGSAVTGVTRKDNRRSDAPAIMVASAITGAGIMLFNGMASIWPGWVTLGFILIVGAVVAFFFRNTFAGRE